MQKLGERRLIVGKRYVGKLIYLKDAQGRTSFKLSFKSKVSSLKTYKRHFGNLQSLDLDSPKKETEDSEGESFDISFKFNDNTLEVKREETQGDITRTLYKVDYPIDKHLFTLLLGDRSAFNPSNPAGEDFVADRFTDGDRVAVIFSFEGTDGKPFGDQATPQFLESKKNRQFLLTFNSEQKELQRLHIAVVKDGNRVRDDFVVGIPHRVTKRT